MSKAYDKINNLCCLNANKYGKSFFGYDDNDVCKDIFEMVDCLSELEKRDRTFDIIKQDSETLEMLLSCFKSAILDATSKGYRRGDNIVADELRDKLGSIKLNELKRRLENEK